MARSIELMPRIDEILAPVQRDLLGLGAILATPDLVKMQEQLAKARIDDARIAELERAIDAGESELEPLRAFILPGGTPKSAALHVARTVCRRAERRAGRTRCARRSRPRGRTSLSLRHYHRRNSRRPLRAARRRIIWRPTRRSPD